MGWKYLVRLLTRERKVYDYHEGYPNYAQNLQNSYTLGVFILLDTSI